MAALTLWKSFLGRFTAGGSICSSLWDIMQKLLILNCELLILSYFGLRFWRLLLFFLFLCCVVFCSYLVLQVQLLCDLRAHFGIVWKTLFALFCLYPSTCKYGPWMQVQMCLFWPVSQLANLLKCFGSCGWLSAYRYLKEGSKEWYWIISW